MFYEILFQEFLGHKYSLTQFGIPTFCEFCSNIIWIMEKGSVCQGKHGKLLQENQTHNLITQKCCQEIIYWKKNMFYAVMVNFCLFSV